MCCLILVPVILLFCGFMSHVILLEIIRFGEVTGWCDKPTVKVAVTVDAPTVVNLVMERLMDS